jgi:predicted nucleotidyltransferase
LNGDLFLLLQAVQIFLYSLIYLIDNVTSKIDRLFGSKTRVALLAKLLSNPDERFYIRELSRDLHIPYSMLYKEEKNLASLSIVLEEKKGKVTLISINKHLPYLSELRKLIAKTAGLGDLLKNAFLKLAGVHYALIYGSIASGEESASSDIDLLIVGETNEETILSIVSLLEKEIGREVNYILWSKDEFMQRVKSKHNLLIDIAAKPIMMLMGDEDEFRRTVKEQNHRANKAEQRHSVKLD